MKKVRTMRVSYRNKKAGLATVESPELRISGNWFQHCGFNVGDQVLITTGKNKLIIRKADV